MKVAVVGGGSTYTPELIDGFARLRAVLPVSEIALVDVNEERLGLLAAVARRMFEREGLPVRVTTSTTVEEAADGATAVLLQLRVGGQATRHRDETWPLDCQCVGQETTGAGGFAKALRTVPVVLDIAERVRRVNPNAWIIDFTNPVGIVTRALLRDGHRALGLCNVAIGFERFFAQLLDVPAEQVDVEHVGLNHLTWSRGVRLRGSEENLLPGLFDSNGAELVARTKQPLELMRLLDAVPSYYLRFYYDHDAVVQEQLGSPTRAEQVAAIEQELLELYRDPATDSKPAQLSGRGGEFYSEAALRLVASLVNDTQDVQVVNTLNRGALPFLPDDFVVEVPAVVGAGGAVPLAQRAMDGKTAGLIAHVAAYEELALEAAIHGGRDRVTAALLTHPLVGQWDLAEKLADRLIRENAEFLAWTQ